MGAHVHIPPATHLPVGVLSEPLGSGGSTKSSIVKAHTASILANVFDNIEISTERAVSFPAAPEYMLPCHSDLLVNSKVFDNAAKPVIKIGPKIGWKLDA